jgi:hypothetical protein
MESKVKLITTASDTNHPGFLMLKKSLDKFGWDYEVLNTTYTAFGTKMVNAYQYAKQTDCTHLFIVDGYDVVVLGTMEEVLSKIPDKECILFNSEKAAWPYEQWGMLYPSVFSEWKYLNGGACFVEVNRFIKLFEASGITHESNDQVNLARLYITEREKHNMKLDNGCKCFQSYAFISEDDYDYQDGRLLNYKTATTPVIIHGNGKTNMDKVYDLLR